MNAETAPKLCNIQALRAAAAFMVIFCHLGILEKAAGLPSFGGAGVDLFFAISGFIMVYTTRDKTVTAWTFLRNRIGRIVPIYYLLTISVFLLLIVTPSLFHHTKPDAVGLLKSLLFIPYVKWGDVVEPVLFVGWTLNYEMFFYLLFAAGLVVPRYESGVLLTISMLVLLVVIGLDGPFGSVIPDFYTSDVLLEFGLGMGTAYLFKPLAQRLVAVWASPALLAVVAICFVLILVIPAFDTAGRLHVLTVSLPSAAIVLCAAILETNGAHITFAPVIALGDASYSLYLTHPFATQAAKKAFPHLPASGASAWLTIGIACAAAVVLAMLSYRYLEKPGTRFARNLLRAFSQRILRALAE